MDLSILQRTTPAAIEDMPYLDSVMQLERHYELELADARFRAALAGAKLK